MANPAKRRVGPNDGTDGTTAGPDTAAPTDRAVPSKAVSSKRVTPPKAQSSSSRYTAPNPASHRGPSPRWVPILMFALWGAGLLVIILNYMGVMPGTGDEGSGWYLVGGLGAILGGIMVATQYR